MWCRCFAKPKKRVCLSKLNKSEKVAWEEITGLLEKIIEPGSSEKWVADRLLEILDNKNNPDEYKKLIKELRRTSFAMEILSNRRSFGLGQIFKNHLGELKPDLSERAIISQRLPKYQQRKVFL